MIYEMITKLVLPCTFRCCEIYGVPYCAFKVSAVSELEVFLLGIAGDMTTRRGPDVARGPDVVHHCFISLQQLILFVTLVSAVLYVSNAHALMHKLFLD